jgi:hypothetical protein
VPQPLGDAGLTKVSPKLASLLERQAPETPVHLNVMLQAGLERPAVQSIAAQIAADGGLKRAPEYLPVNGILSLECPLQSVRMIAQRPDVVWVDVEARAAIGELID